MQLGSHGDRRAELGVGHFAAGLREAEVSDDDLSVVHEDVRELEVAVHDLLSPEHFEAFHDLPQELHGFAFGEDVVFFLLHVAFEVASVAELQHHVVVVVGLEELEEVQDVWVVDFVHDVDLLVEQRAELGVLVDVLREAGLPLS